jgi:hypothetical protein
MNTLKIEPITTVPTTAIKIDFFVLAGTDLKPMPHTYTVKSAVQADDEALVITKSTKNSQFVRSILKFPLQQGWFLRSIPN